MISVKTLKNFLLFLFAVSFFFACTNTPDRKLKKLAHVYVDLEIAAVFAPNSDSLQTLKKNVYAKYSLTEKKYDSLLNSLPPEREIWQKFFDYASEYVDSLKKEELEKNKL